MPSNQTPNYQLSQWEADDRIFRTDFNADNAKIDAVLARLEAAAAAIPRFFIGTYVGDGTWGADHPTSLTFPFEPKFVVITSGRSGGYFVRGGPGILNWNGGDTSNWSLAAKWEGSKLSWTTGLSNADQQLNRLDSIYTYLAIG